MTWRRRARQVYWAVVDFLKRWSLARMTLAIPRTVRFMLRALRTHEVATGVPSPDFTLALVAGVAVDEALMAAVLAPHRFPLEADYARVGEELARARRMYEENGWLDNPRDYHRLPPPLGSSAVVSARRRLRGVLYEQLQYESGFSPREGEPGRERWESYLPNRRAVANIVRHGESERPWLICVHGFTMGFPIMDFHGLQTARLHEELGLNIALPALPLHGPRKVTRLSGEPFLSFEMMNSIHGLAQSVWDIRRLISWIRGQGGSLIGLYGVSLGGYVVALLSGLEEGLGASVAGIPATDIPALFATHSPPSIRARAAEHGALDTGPRNPHRVVSPLAIDPLLPRDRRFIFAGYGDRLAFPEQAQRLWEHWEEPEICWFTGGHVGYLWSADVASFLVDSLVRSGFQAAPSRPAERARAPKPRF